MSLPPWWRLVKFGFRLLYNEMAFTYDTVSKVVSMGAWRCWQRAAIKHLAVPRGARVLELAHGTGDLQLDLYTAGYNNLIGYDLSPYMGHIARCKLVRRKLPARLVRGRVQRLPFKTAAFDAIICTFPTDFIIETATLREAHRVLRPDGRFVIVINGAFTGGGVSVKILEWLYRVTGQRQADKSSTDQQKPHISGDSQSLREQVYGRFLKQFRDCGFNAQIIQEPCPRSIAQLVIAQRID